MRAKEFVFGVLFVGMTAGCASKVPMEWSASGGSRADATVELAYQYNAMNQVPQTSSEQADRVAAQRCKAWGYESAEPFGMQRTKCQQFGTGFYAQTCLDMVVSLQYQCLGDGGALKN